MVEEDICDETINLWGELPNFIWGAPPRFLQRKSRLKVRGLHHVQSPATFVGGF